MSFFRNPEILKGFFELIIISVFLVAAGFSVSIKCSVLIIIACVLFISFYLANNYARYKKIARLSYELDDMLHSKRVVNFKEYEEGELAILKNELEKLTQKLAEQAEALKKDKKYLADAMTDISHQLRSPLTSSRIIVTLLNEPDISKERHHELISELGTLHSRIDWLIETLLKMSKMDADTAYLKYEQVYVKDLINRALEPVLISMELREIEVKFIQNDINESFMGDISWTAEALLNILKNCMEHTPLKGLIEIKSLDNFLYTEIIVEDNGRGFSEESIPHLFERFYQGKDSLSENIGIGLALARMIIMQQNGTIKAENRKEGGARFIIRFYKYHS